MRTIILLIVLLPTISFGQQPPVKFGGLYEIDSPVPSKPNDDSFYFRFFADGLVIAARSTPNNVRNLRSTMTYERRGQWSVGFYSYHDGMLVVVVNGDTDTGALLYTGKVDANNNDTIRLDLKFYIDGSVQVVKSVPYKFKPF